MLGFCTVSSFSGLLKKLHFEEPCFIPSRSEAGMCALMLLGGTGFLGFPRAPIRCQNEFFLFDKMIFWKF